MRVSPVVGQDAFKDRVNDAVLVVLAELSGLMRRCAVGKRLANAAPLLLLPRRRMRARTVLQRIRRMNPPYASITTGTMHCRAERYSIALPAADAPATCHRHSATMLRCSHATMQQVVGHPKPERAPAVASSRQSEAPGQHRTSKQNGKFNLQQTVVTGTRHEWVQSTPSHWPQRLAAPRGHSEADPAAQR